MHILLRAAGAAIDKGKVSFLHARTGNLEGALGPIGNIGLGIIGRHIVCTGVDAEDGEISGVAGPHPVVRLSSEFADGRRRSTHQAHIPVFAEDEQEVLVAVVQGLHAGLEPVPFLGGFLQQLLGVLVNQGLALLFGHLGLVSLEHHLRHILHAFQEADGEAGVGELVGPGLGPEAVLEVVVLHGGMPLDEAVAAVVVGEQEALVAHQLSGAAAAEQHHGVFQAGLVHAVDVFGRQLEALGLHVFNSLGNQGGQPHAFIGLGGHCPKREKRCKDNGSFHAR